MIAAQGQGLMTNGLKKVCELTVDGKCRFCHKEIESPSHLMSGCKILLADGHYTVVSISQENQEDLQISALEDTE